MFSQSTLTHKECIYDAKGWNDLNTLLIFSISEKLTCEESDIRVEIDCKDIRMSNLGCFGY